MKISSHTIGGVYREALAVRAASPTQQCDRQHGHAHQHQQAGGPDLSSERPQDQQYHHKARKYDKD